MVLVPFLKVAAKDSERTNAIMEPCKTGRDAEGPFYKPGSPMRDVIETEGDPCI